MVFPWVRQFSLRWDCLKRLSPRRCPRRSVTERGDSRRIATNKKPGGIRVRIVPRVPAAQTSKLQGSTLVFVPRVANWHPSHRVSCIKSVFSSCAPWMPPVGALRKPHAVWTTLKFKIAMFIQWPSKFFLFEFVALFSFQTGRVDTTHSFLLQTPSMSTHAQLCRIWLFFCRGEYNKERWVCSFDGESCLVKTARRIVWIFPCSSLGGRVAETFTNYNFCAVKKTLFLHQFLKIFSFKNMTAARCRLSI